MARTIAIITALASVIAGVVLNFMAAGTAGKNLFEMAMLSDFGVAVLVWTHYPVAALVILLVLIVSLVVALAPRNPNRPIRIKR